MNQMKERIIGYIFNVVSFVPSLLKRKTQNKPLKLKWPSPILFVMSKNVFENAYK